MDYAQQQRDPTKHMIGIGFVVLIHVLVIWALIAGLGKTIVEIVKKPLTATIIQEIKLPPPPPPPPKKIIEPPKAQAPVEPYVPPPDIPVAAPQTAPVISAVAPTPPPEPHVIAAPVVAPPAPAPKPAVRRGVVRLSGDDPSYPREAIRASVKKGKVTARININGQGVVTGVTIVSAEPPRHFDRAVREALETWRFKAEGEAYVAEIEINFTLAD